MRAVVHDLQEPNRPHASHTGASWATASRPPVVPVRIPVGEGFAPTHEYVRRYWVAALGAGPVEELLRLTTAAERRQAIRRPVFLATLVIEGLAVVLGELVAVPDPIPPLGSLAQSRLTPSLRAEHARFMVEWRAESGRHGWQ